MNGFDPGFGTFNEGMGRPKRTNARTRTLTQQFPSARSSKAPLAENVMSLRQMQGVCRNIIRRTKALWERGFALNDEYAILSNDFSRLMSYYTKIADDGLVLPFCDQLKPNDIRAGLLAITGELENGSAGNLALKAVKYRALSIAIGGHPDHEGIVGDPMVAIGPRALQLGRYVAHLSAMGEAANTILNDVLQGGNMDGVVALSKKDKRALARVVRKMEDNFPYKMRSKVYCGPKAIDDYNIVPIRITYRECYGLKKVIADLMRYICRRIEEPSRFIGKREREQVVRYLKRVADEAGAASGKGVARRNRRKNLDSLLKAYLNATILFSHGQYADGAKVLDNLRDQLLEHWPRTARTERVAHAGQSGRNGDDTNKSGVG